MNRPNVLIPIAIFLAVTGAVLGLIGIFGVAFDLELGQAASVSSKFTVRLGSGGVSGTVDIPTDKLIFTQVGDWLIKDKRTEKWTLIKGDARVIVNDPTALKLIPVHQGRKASKPIFFNQKRTKV